MEKYSSVKTEDSDSGESLLRNGDEISFENDRAESFTLGQRNRSWFNRHKILICLTLSSWHLIWYLVSLFISGLNNDTPITLFWGIALKIIRYEGKQLDLPPVYLPDGTLNPDKPGHFNGKTTRELAEAWKGIMQHQNI
ncbi:uncharacterized protein BDW70DRAFT_134589 [Aspergillus foveolatus]|uniref:uncharacterized protein n=1 Tax=Aspergillus foveolatus TaxID=210207 RepID=UPI003CCDDFD8